MYAHANALTAMPKAPGIRQGPQVREEAGSAGESRDGGELGSRGGAMAPVQRRHRRREQHIRYEAYKPLMVRDMTSLKAVDEPIMMRPRRQAMVVVTATERRGIELRGSTYLSVVSVLGDWNYIGGFQLVGEILLC